MPFASPLLNVCVEISLLVTVSCLVFILFFTQQTKPNGGFSIKEMMCLWIYRWIYIYLFKMKGAYETVCSHGLRTIVKGDTHINSKLFFLSLVGGLVVGDFPVRRC